MSYGLGMNTPSQSHGYMAFKALQNASFALRQEGFDAAAQEVDGMALRLREILYAATNAAAETADAE